MGKIKTTTQSKTITNHTMKQSSNEQNISGIIKIYTSTFQTLFSTFTCNSINNIRTAFFFQIQKKKLNKSKETN